MFIDYIRYKFVKGANKLLGKNFSKSLFQSSDLVLSNLQYAYLLKGAHVPMDFEDAFKIMRGQATRFEKLVTEDDGKIYSEPLFSKKVFANDHKCRGFTSINDCKVNWTSSLVPAPYTREATRRLVKQASEIVNLSLGQTPFAGKSGMLLSNAYEVVTDKGVNPGSKPVPELLLEVPKVA